MKDLIKLILRSAQARDFFSQGRELEVEGRRQQRLSSKIIVHLVCVIIMYTIYEMYTDVASSHTSSTSFLNAEAVCCCW